MGNLEKSRYVDNQCIETSGGVLECVINPRRACCSEGYSSRSVCLSVRRTTGYKAANEWHQRVVNNEKIDINVAIFLKRLRSRDMA